MDVGAELIHLAVSIGTLAVTSYIGLKVRELENKILRDMREESNRVNEGVTDHERRIAFLEGSHNRRIRGS